jgi:hypothetical protein
LAAVGVGAERKALPVCVVLLITMIISNSWPEGPVGLADPAGADSVGVAMSVGIAESAGVAALVEIPVSLAVIPVALGWYWPSSNV